MKKLLLLPLAALTLLGAGCSFTTDQTPPPPVVENQPPATTPPISPPVTPPVVTATSTDVLTVLTQAWQKDGELSAYASRPADLNASLKACPSISVADDGTHIPAGASLLYSLPTQDCSSVLRVYLHCEQSLSETADPQWVQANGAYYACGSWKATLLVEKASTHQSSLLGDIFQKSTGNAGGIFMPLAFTHDAKHIILDAWMFSPGAGGGSVDFGYDIIPTVPNATASAAPLVPREALFNSDKSAVVYLANSSKLPSYSQPGPASNLGIIDMKSLANNAITKLLEEPNTTYQLVSLDASANTLHFQANAYTFSKSCPATQVDALLCASKKTSDRTLSLPKT